MAEITFWLIHFDGRLWTDPDGAPRCFASEAAAESEAQACAEYAALMLGRDNVASWSVREFRLVPAAGGESEAPKDEREKVHAFCEKPDGTRNRTVEWSDKVEVQVCSRCGADDSDVARAAEQIADFARVVERHEAEVLQFRGQEADLHKRLAEAKRQIPPKRPARMLGRGYVRFLDGKPVLLNRRERGFGEFGFTCESWDQLFREFDVRITAHGVDEHGPWWAAEPGVR